VPPRDVLRVAKERGGSEEAIRPGLVEADAIAGEVAVVDALDGARGLTGLYLTDGGLDLASCVLMIGLFLRWSKRSRVPPKRSVSSLAGASRRGI